MEGLEWLILKGCYSSKLYILKAGSIEVQFDFALAIKSDKIRVTMHGLQVDLSKKNLVNSN